MSRSLRPVVETWGPHSSCFLDHEELLVFLNAIMPAELEENREDGTTLTWTDGERFLKAISELPDDLSSFLQECGLDQAVYGKDAQCLAHNLKALANDWEKFLEDGQLRLLID